MADLALGICFYAVCATLSPEQTIRLMEDVSAGYTQLATCIPIQDQLICTVTKVQEDAERTEFICIDDRQCQGGIQ